MVLFTMPSLPYQLSFQLTPVRRFSLPADFLTDAIKHKITSRGKYVQFLCGIHRLAAIAGPKASNASGNHTLTCLCQ